MTLAAQTHTINCTACGAGLDVLGGGRVTTHICGYCGAALDAVHGYKVLREYSGMSRPDTPFALGMQAEIEGVAFTIIGTLGWEERWQGQVWTWVDHQLFSPTHGYAWMSVEEGHLVFTRKYRGPVSPGFITPAQVERAESRPTARAGGARYRYYETSTALITFAEGEFTWMPRIGDTATAVSLLGDRTMLSFQQSATEREVEVSSYLPPQTYLDFGAELPPGRSRNHPLMPYKALNTQPFFWRSALLMGVLALLLGFVLSTMPGTLVARVQDIPVTTLPQEVPFTITDTERLTKVRVNTNVSNSWAYMDIAVTGPDDQPVFEAGREVGYYHGRDADGRWTEGSTRTTLLFHAPAPGDYTVELEVSEAGTWLREGAALTVVGVEVFEGESSGKWLFMLAAIFAVVPTLFLLRRMLALRRKWSGSDWVDEEDD